MRRAVLFCALALSLSAPLLAQGAPTSSSPAQATHPASSPLPSLIETSQLLKARLETRKAQAQAQAESWQSIEQALRQEIKKGKLDSIASSAKLAQVETELSKSLADLTAISNLLAALSTDFDSYKSKAESKIAALSIEVKAYKTAGGILLSVMAVIGGYYGGHALGVW
jgi:chromosome segregation ATPase